MDMLDEILDRVNKLNDSGRLTIDSIFNPGFYRLLEGPYANRVILYDLVSKIDGQPIVIFVNSMTWEYREKIKDTRCEATRPTFNAPRNKVDTSKSSWMADNGDGPLNYEW